MPANCIFRSDQVAVTDSPVVLFDTTLDVDREYYGYIKNIGAECVYIGCDSVTDNCGYELNGREEMEIRFFESVDKISAVCKSEESSNVCWFLSAYN